MKNDAFFNWLLIIITLLISIGMFKHGLPYFWIPYLISLLLLARYTDFLESKERDEAVVSFPTKKWSDEITSSDYHMASLEYSLIKDDDGNYYHALETDCDECGYFICVCKPVVNK